MYIMTGDAPKGVADSAHIRNKATYLYMANYLAVAEIFESMHIR